MSNWGLADKLRAWRKGRRLTQTEVATALKMTRGGYANYEAASAPIPERRLDALKAMGFRGSDPNPSSSEPVVSSVQSSSSMRIGSQLRAVRAAHESPRQFYKLLSSSTGIDISRLRKLSADQANATQHELSLIREFCKLPSAWPVANRTVERNTEQTSPRLILSLINSIAHPNTPAEVRQQLAQELIDLLDLHG